MPVMCTCSGRQCATKDYDALLEIYIVVSKCVLSIQETCDTIDTTARINKL